MNPKGNISDLFLKLKTDPKLLDELKVVIVPYESNQRFLWGDRGDVARLEIVTDDDGTHYVIYPPKHEPAFDVDKALRVEEIFAENKWKAYWDSEDDYPEMNLQWVEEYFESSHKNKNDCNYDYQAELATYLAEFATWSKIKTP